MKKVQYSEKVERYCNCPHCGALLSDDDPNVNFDQKTVKCPNCNNSFQVSESWESAYRNQKEYRKPSEDIIVTDSVWETKTWGSQWGVVSINPDRTVNIERIDVPENANPEWNEFHKTLDTDTFLLHYRRIR